MFLFSSLVASIAVFSMSGPSSSKRPPDEPIDHDKRRRVLNELASYAGVSRQGLSKTLHGLHEHGLLRDPLTNETSVVGYLRSVNQAFELEAMRSTPFGPLLCESELPTVEENRRKQRRHCMWYVSPFALLFTVCAVSLEFFS